MVNVNVEPKRKAMRCLVDLVRGLLEHMARCGIAILLLEQKLTIALAISHRLYVMGQGRIVFEGSPQACAPTSSCAEWLEV